MEQLPNEILLMIFNYLDKLDVLYAFEDLNLRFSHLIISHTGLDIDIDITNKSYKIYQWFIERIIAIKRFNIRSLSLKKFYQMKLLKENIVQLSSLKSLKWKWLSKYDYSKYSDGDIKYYIKKLQNFPQLTDLYIYGEFSVIDMLADIISITSLISLTLLSGEYRYYYHGQYNLTNVYMSSIKVLTINLSYLTQLSSILAVVNNLEALNLSFIHFSGSEYLTIPKSLNRLHLEYIQESTNKYPLTIPVQLQLQQFLLNFKNKLHTLKIMLTLITNDPLRPLMNIYEFLDFMETFPGLHAKCQYLLYVNDFTVVSQPSNVGCHIKKLPNKTYILYTNPCPRSFYCTSFEDVYSYINHSNEGSRFTRLFNNYQSTLTVIAENSQQIIEQLNLMTNPLVKITKLECESVTTFGNCFLIELSKIMPNLRSLCLLNGINLLANDTELKLTVAIDHIQEYFLHLFDFCILINVRKRDEKYRFEEFKQWLKLKRHGSDNQQKDNFYVEYSSNNNNKWFLKLWF